MNEAHLAAMAPRSVSGGPVQARPGSDPFVLREDLRRFSVLINQFGSWRMHGLSFALLVVLPILCAAIYYGLIAAGKYSVEFRLALDRRRSSCADDDKLALLIKAGKSGHTKSGISLTWPRTICEAAMSSGNSIGTVGCGRYFRGIRRIGCLASIQRRATIDLWLYWRETINVNVDRVSGLVLVRVLAFTPEDMRRSARTTSVSAEKMIDSVAIRERRDALFSADQELELREPPLFGGAHGFA